MRRNPKDLRLPRHRAQIIGVGQRRHRLVAGGDMRLERRRLEDCRYFCMERCQLFDRLPTGDLPVASWTWPFLDRRRNAKTGPAAFAADRDGRHSIVPTGTAGFHSMQAGWIGVQTPRSRVQAISSSGVNDFLHRQHRGGRAWSAWPQTVQSATCDTDQAAGAGSGGTKVNSARNSSLVRT